MSYSRRDLGLLLPALAVTAAEEAQAQPQPQPQPQPQQGGKKVLPSKAYVYADLPVKENGPNKQRAVLNGATHTGYPIEMHMSELGPGEVPHAPHTHVNEEMLMLRTGLLDVTVKGETTRLTPGSTIYVASNELHGWKNPGPERAEYFVVAFGQGLA